MPEDSNNRGKDDHLGLRFWVQIDSVEIAGFRECSALSIETEVFEYPEGGLNTYTHKLPVRTKYGNITLKRGLDVTHDLYSWYVASIDGVPNKRKNVSIMIYGPLGGEPVEKWDLMDAYPVKWVGPELKTEAAALAVETLEFAHHGLVRGSD
ncbi:MAG TPA: phage tail protein [Fimbriimonadaceae bacterium]|nr:phage tail protein [Fimbriimonadaceae bacterium]